MQVYVQTQFMREQLHKAMIRGDKSGRYMCIEVPEGHGVGAASLERCSMHDAIMEQVGLQWVEAEQREKEWGQVVGRRLYIHWVSGSCSSFPGTVSPRP